jgi:hypothetical protein
MAVTIVVDTNVFIGTPWEGNSPNREVIRGCLTGHYRPLMGAALLHEYEDIRNYVSSTPEDPS